MHHDLIVIGSDEAACAAAFEGARHKLDVLLLDDGGLDRDGFARRRALIFHTLREVAADCLERRRSLDPQSPDASAAPLSLEPPARLSEQIADNHLREIGARLTALGIPRLRSSVCLLSEGRVMLESGETRESPIILIASGSRPRQSLRFSIDGGVLCDPWTVTSIDALPRNLLVIGAENVGCEFACAFAALGSRVTLLDRRNRMLRYADRDLIESLHTRMKELDIEVVLGETLESISVEAAANAPHALVRLGSGRVDRFERVLLVAGQEPHFGSIDFGSLEIGKDAAGFLLIDDSYRTTIPGIYAAGGATADLPGNLRAHQGRAAVRHAFGLEDADAGEAIRTIYTIPEISMVGLTQEMCDRLSIPCAVGCASYRDVAYGQIRSEPDGVVKVVADRDSRRILGIHLLGPSSRELAPFGALLLNRSESIDAMAVAHYSDCSLSQVFQHAAEECIARLGSAAPEPCSQA